ncbi:MAG: hypothetical protein JRD04_05905 [Deltaproteobacteria bacterium]|nr:hypothetical protein [Deltaproteobacteria bacterium]
MKILQTFRRSDVQIQLREGNARKSQGDQLEKGPEHIGDNMHTMLCEQTKIGEDGVLAEYLRKINGAIKFTFRILIPIEN